MYRGIARGRQRVGAVGSAPGAASGGISDPEGFSTGSGCQGDAVMRSYRAPWVPEWLMLQNG